MKNPVKLLSILMTAILALSMASCKKKGIDIRELQKNEGVMLTVIGIPNEPMTIEDRDACTTILKVTYDGYAFIPNPYSDKGEKISDGDYLKLYNFCVNSVERNTFENYSEDVCDGTTYRFTFYDKAGNPTVIYDGYCYNNEELQDIKKTIEMYSVG